MEEETGKQVVEVRGGIVDGIPVLTITVTSPTIIMTLQEARSLIQVIRTCLMTIEQM